MRLYTQELQHAAAVRLQAIARAWIAHKKCTAWGEVKRQRMRDTSISSRKIQVSPSPWRKTAPPDILLSLDGVNRWIVDMNQWIVYVSQWMVYVSQ